MTDPLRIALAAGRINHAYLFSGPRGCGKTSSARIMARSLNCAKGPTPDPCGECNSCRNLAPEGPGSVDVTELDAASHGGVDDARELRDRAFYAPADSRYRVFIIDEAHMVTTQGFNALLKIVEEPPEHLIFIFATTEPDKVLPTIRSRTHHYPFRLIPPKSMRELLERNVAAEGAQVEPAVYPLVIRAGGGSARDTQSVLDQLLAGAGPDGVDYPRAVSLLGVTDVALIDGMVDALAADDASAVFGTVESLAEAGHDPRRFATDLLDRLRDLVMLRSVPDAGERGLVSAPDDELKKMKEQAGKLEPATLSRYADIVHSGLLEMRGATSPRLVLELLTARMLLPSVAEGADALLARLERLERRAASAPAPVAGAVQAAPAAPVAQSSPVAQSASAAASAAPAGEPVREFQRPSQRSPAPAQQPEPARQSAPAPQPVARPEPVAERPAPQRPAAPPPPAAPAAAAAAVSPSAGGTDTEGIRGRWPNVLAAIRKAPGGTVTASMLTQASVANVEGNAVTLTHNAEPLARRLSEPHNAERIAAAFKEVFGGDWQVRCVHGAAQARQAAAPKAAAAAPSAPERSFTRRSAEAPGAAPAPPPPKPEPQRPKVATTEPDIPLPPEPVEDDEELYSEDASPAPPPPPLPPDKDPDEIARKLLADHLNARPLEERT